MLLLWLLHAPCVALAQATPSADARPSTGYASLIDEAVFEFERGHWAESRALFDRAHALYPNARTLRGLGMTDFNLRAYERAITELESALSEPERALDAPLREHVLELLGRANRYVARYQIALRPATAVLTVDAHPPLRDREGRVLLALGTHTLRLSAPGHRPLEHSIEVLSPREDALVLAATPIPPPAPPVTAEDTPRRALRPRTWAWVATSSALALVAAGTATWLAADARFREAQRQCVDGCVELPAHAAQIPRLERASYALWSLGGALALGATALWLMGPSPSAAAALRETPPTSAALAKDTHAYDPTRSQPDALDRVQARPE